LALAQAVPTATKIYLAPDDHTDYFWTADDVEYRAAFIEMLDYYLDRIDENIDQPLEFQPKWNCDGSLWLWEYEHHKTKQEFDRLMTRVADGHISSPLNALVSTYGGQPAEAVLRGMYYAGDLERRFNLRFPLAVAMENQTLPLGLGALWSGAGAKYSWRGICGCATKMPYAPFQRRDHEVYWWRGLDNSRILMKWYSLGNNNESVGGYAEARNPDQAIDFITTDQGFLKRHPYATVGLFGQGWDDLKTLDNSFPAIARRRSTRDQQVIVSNEEDYFRAFERRYGGDLPVVTEAYGNEWDILCASMAKQTARVRRAVEQLRTAEAIAAIVNQHDTGFWKKRKTQRDLAHLNLGLYWEHDWTSDANETMRQKRAHWQKRLADQISSYAERLQADAENKLASLVAARPSSIAGLRSYLIFNPLGWERDTTVAIEGDFQSDVKIIDVNTNAVLNHHCSDGGKILVRVNDIPPVGFTTIEISPPPSNPARVPVQGNPIQGIAVQGLPVQGHTIENRQFKIIVDVSGVVSSVIQKSSGRELVSTKGFNQLLRDGKPILSKATVAARKLGSVGQQLEIQRIGPIKSQTIITLTQDDGILIENKILQNFSQTLSWSFDLLLQDFELTHEEVGAIVKADLVSNGGHYANRNARYDWLSAGHFVRLSETGFAVDIANHDCSFFKFGQSVPQKLDTTQPRVQFLIGGQIDGPELGILNQYGDATFTQRFSIRTVKLAETSETSETSDMLEAHEASDGKAAKSNCPMAWALERTNPAIAIELNSDSDGILPAKYALLQIDSNDEEVHNLQSVLLWSIKPAESSSDSDTVARWWNVSNHAQTITFKFPNLKLIQPVSHIETDLTFEKPVAADQSNQFELSFSQHQLRTFRLKFAQPRK